MIDDSDDDMNPMYDYWPTNFWHKTEWSFHNKDNCNQFLESGKNNFFIEFFKRKHWIRRCLVAVSGLILVYQIENSILLQIIAFLPFAMLIVVMVVACRKRVQ